MFNDVVSSHYDTAEDFGLGGNAAARADGDVSLYDREGADLDVIGEGGLWRDEGLRVNVWHQFGKRLGILLLLESMSLRIGLGGDVRLRFLKSKVMACATSYFVVI